ncbi:unnamed protein product [Chilo suppressalis]|uniref:Polypeptide N-acetylgalactosaminyltransferase n=1 Tax=Chilo suppressalis TaxID=168631 RepID=A0ABN8ARU9_CHISP|nr:unnamed protein product [Chilo suppressalis]
MLMNENQLYEQALDAFTNRYEYDTTTHNISMFQAWQSIEAVETLGINEKMSVIKNNKVSPGSNGNGVYLNTDIRKSLKYLIQKGWKNHAFNQFVSDLIPLNRSLLDVRDDWCKHQIYSKNLPQATVIICFHNEAWSTLLRTVYSILNRSPSYLLKEIILFDDFSTMDHLKQPLEEHLRNLPKVVLKRSPKREGLIRARIQATKEATTSVVIFLDSHCECTEGWLEPLLDRIAQDPTTVTSPMVDDIHDSTFEYMPQNSNEIYIGGFNWELKFKWKPIPRNVLAKRDQPAAPIKTPTISGGLFAINKDFFKKLGYYDEGFDIWGAENLELSFKTWMCGGSLEIIPCSHVGHVFRKRFPYVGQSGAVRRNSMRLAEVWMDEYAQYFYDTIGKDKRVYGNVSERVKLRNSLNCKSFQWYLDNIYPQLELPDNYVASGQIYSLSNFSVCLDSSMTKEEWGVNLFPCHHQGGNQYWVYTKNGEIKREDKCLEHLFSILTLYFCKGRTGSQTWIYNTKTKHIRHLDLQKCLQVKKYVDKKLRLTLEDCSTASTQKWEMENFYASRLNPLLRMYERLN